MGLGLASSALLELPTEEANPNPLTLTLALTLALT